MSQRRFRFVILSALVGALIGFGGAIAHSATEVSPYRYWTHWGVDYENYAALRNHPIGYESAFTNTLHPSGSDLPPRHMGAKARAFTHSGDLCAMSGWQYNVETQDISIGVELFLRDGCVYKIRHYAWGQSATRGGVGGSFVIKNTEKTPTLYIG